MSKVCCISLPLATRMIGTYTMSLSILMMNIFLSNFFSRKTDEDFFDTVETWAFLGLNWAQIVRNSDTPKRAQVVLGFIVVYNMLFLMASAYLAVGSLSRKPKSAVPWLYLQIISITDQSVALAIHLTHDKKHDSYDGALLYIPMACIYMLMCSYFYMVVQTAKSEWSEEPGSCEEFDRAMPVIASPPATSSEPKTPSFLSQNFSMFASPEQPILPK